jgi:cobyrinic acid a,c-diamide synthase
MPRIAVGTVQHLAEGEPITWGLLAALRRFGHSPQAFRSQACFATREGARVITGRPSRHLDSWMMDPGECCEAFQRGMRESDLALVTGEYDTALPDNSCTPRGGSLDTLCQWLDLPKVAIVDVSLPLACSLPRPPQKLDALLLDRVASERDYERLRVEFEVIWGVPVLGWLDEAKRLRELVCRLPPGSEPTIDLCSALSERLQRHFDLRRFLQLAERSRMREIEASHLIALPSRQPLRVAVAYAEGFSSYFPDTLDRLETAGAIIRDFSPLTSGSLPEGTDLVYFGCGHPERHLAALATNHCLQQSLRSYAAAGGRIYGEGAGMAYLCRQIVLPDGRVAPMCGLLPATARMVEPAREFEPVEITFGESCWLAAAKSKLRGYRHTGWQIEPTGAMLTYAQSPGNRLDVLGRGNVIGSRLLVDFGAQVHLLRRFFAPYRTYAAST